ncbi:hypothetical protein LINPERHAP1_LOCUS32585 [Linum perenne]
MACLWRPGRGMEVEELGNRLVLFHFNHMIDLRRVLEMGPWVFDSSLLVLRELQRDETLYTVPLVEADLWVQVHDFSVGYFSATVGKVLGDYVGKFVLYDERNSFSFAGPFMRIIVTLDIRKPLKREKRKRQTVRPSCARLSMRSFLTFVIYVARSAILTDIAKCYFKFRKSK